MTERLINWLQERETAERGLPEPEALSPELEKQILDWVIPELRANGVIRNAAAKPDS